MNCLHQCDECVKIQKWIWILCLHFKNSSEQWKAIQDNFPERCSAQTEGNSEKKKKWNEAFEFVIYSEHCSRIGRGEMWVSAIEETPRSDQVRLCSFTSQSRSFNLPLDFAGDGIANCQRTVAVADEVGLLASAGNIDGFFK